MPAGYAVARARPLPRGRKDPRHRLPHRPAARPLPRGRKSVRRVLYGRHRAATAPRGRERRGNCRHVKGRTPPDVAGADERASRSRILALWEDRSAPHPAAATRKPRDHAETSGRVQRGGANDPPRAPFLRPAPRGPAGAFPTDPSGGARGCRDARPTGSPSGRRVGITTTPRDLTPRDAPGRRRRASFRYPWSSGVRLLRSFPFTTPLHPPLYEKKGRSGGSRGVVDGKRRSRGAARTGTGRSDDCPRARLSRR